MSARRVKPSRCISVDIEADGPIPGPYSMLSIGAAVAGTQDAGGFTPADPEQLTFYRELRPISDDFVPEALAVSGLDRDRLVVRGAEPAVALAEFSAWVREVSTGAQPVMCGYPEAGLPLRAVAKGTMPRPLLSRRRHTHHALDDAIEQAELLANLMAWPGPGGAVPLPD
ncbi:exonuclease [Streptomyces sp. NPDC001709]